MAAEELDSVSDLRQSWKKLRKRASEATEELHQMQVWHPRCTATVRHYCEQALQLPPLYAIGLLHTDKLQMASEQRPKMPLS